MGLKTIISRCDRKLLQFQTLTSHLQQSLELPQLTTPSDYQLTYIEKCVPRFNNRKLSFLLQSFVQKYKKQEKSAMK